MRLRRHGDDRALTVRDRIASRAILRRIRHNMARRQQQTDNDQAYRKEIFLQTLSSCRSFLHTLSATNFRFIQASFPSKKAFLPQREKLLYAATPRRTNAKKNPLPIARRSNGDRQAGSSPGSVHRSAAPSQGNAPVTSLQLRSPHSGGTAPAYPDFLLNPCRYLLHSGDFPLSFMKL